MGAELARLRRPASPAISRVARDRRGRSKSPVRTRPPGAGRGTGGQGVSETRKSEPPVPPDAKASESMEERESQRAVMPVSSRSGTLDPELEEYRNLMVQPSTFGEGFTWVSVAGAIFCGL